MENEKFSMEEAVGFGWDIMKTNFWFFVGAFILSMVVQNAPQVISDIIKKDYPLIAFIFALASFFLSILLSIGWIKISLRFCDQEQGDLHDLFGYARIFLKFIVAQILCCLAIVGGFILLIIPGIIMMVRLQFYPYLIVDKNLGPIESLRKSFSMTKGSAWKLFCFGLLLAAINLAGALCLLVGLLATVPPSMIAVAFVYRKFLAADETTIVPIGTTS